jgi:hypothetical protein
MVTMAVVGWLVGVAPQVRAHDAYNDSDSHPLRIAAWAVSPVGFFTEWLVTRPIHFLVSNPRLERVFNHGPSESPYGDYPAYQPDVH